MIKKLQICARLKLQYGRELCEMNDILSFVYYWILLRLTLSTFTGFSSPDHLFTFTFQFTFRLLQLQSCLLPFPFSSCCNCVGFSLALSFWHYNIK